MTTMPQPYDPAIRAVIDEAGFLQLEEYGSYTEQHLGTVVDAQRFVAARAVEAAGRSGETVLMESVDPSGSWFFLATPDGALESVMATAPATLEPGPEADEATPDLAEPEEDLLDPDQEFLADESTLLPAEAAYAGEPDPAQEADLGYAEDPAAREEADAQPEPKPRRALPTLDDLLQSRPEPPPGPATTGWQGALRRGSFGAINPRPSEQELRHRAAVATIQRSLAGPRTVVVVNPKGGASKTTATMLLAATFATHRGGYTLAWDNNETRGTLGWRALPSRHANTAVDLLADLDRFQEVRRARVGDLDNYVRSQGEAQFDVLASDEDASASASIDDDAFNRLHATLSRFYRVLVIDTGNNMRASNWEAAVDAADQLVVVSTLRDDTAASAAWLIDGLRAKGHADKVAQAVTVLTAPSQRADSELSARLHDHFGQLTRAVVDVPHDEALVSGGTIEVGRLARTTRDAWVHATAAVAEGL